MAKKPTKNSSLWQRLRTNRLAWNLFLIAVIMLALALSAHILMQIATRHGARRTVPDFSGITLHDAERLAAKHDLELHINDSLFVPAYEGGIILDQLPEQGVEVKPGRTVYVTINSFRQKMVPVPYVAGRSLRQAKNMLEIAGLEIKELVYSLSGTYPDLKARVFGAMQRLPLPEWGIEGAERRPELRAGAVSRPSADLGREPHRSRNGLRHHALCGC